MNCYAYMSNAARSSVAARVMGKAWFSDLDEGTDQHEDQYFFLVWKPVVDVVKATRLNATADKNKIKARTDGRGSCRVAQDLFVHLIQFAVDGQVHLTY